jgi:hypothetical protein
MITQKEINQTQKTIEKIEQAVNERMAALSGKHIYPLTLNHIGEGDDEGKLFFIEETAYSYGDTHWFTIEELNMPIVDFVKHYKERLEREEQEKADKYRAELKKAELKKLAELKAKYEK